MTQKNRELTAGERVGIAVVGILQVAFAFLAAWDLWHRPAAGVRGSKWAWAPVLLVNWLGPGAYFVFGIKHDTR